VRIPLLAFSGIQSNPASLAENWGHNVFSTDKLFVTFFHYKSFLLCVAGGMSVSLILVFPALLRNDVEKGNDKLIYGEHFPKYGHTVRCLLITFKNLCMWMVIVAFLRVVLSFE
jgi:hypothetical protein